MIAGGPLRGNLYGVYGLLEDHLGCRWFAPGVSRIPHIARIALGPIDETKIPVLEYREPYTFDCMDGDWCARNRMNSSSARLEARHGGRVRFADGLFVHTFARLVPPAKYFAAHPEYFSLVGGKRQNGYAQLCCTNEDVIRICTEEIRAAMRAQPDATVFSVSQNDTDKHCECPRCQALARQEGSQGAPVLNLVNRVAEAVEKEFPGKAVETLAYQWTRQAPKTMRPRPNVIVRLCSIECCFSHPLATCDSRENRAFRDGPSGLVEGLPAALDLGLYDRLRPLPDALSQPAGAAAQHPLLRRQPRERHLRAGHLRHAPQRTGRPGRLPDGQVPLGPGLRPGPGHERVSRRILRPGGPADPAVHRPPARSGRAGQHPRSHLRPAHEALPGLRTAAARPMRFGKRPRSWWRAMRTFCGGCGFRG